MVTYAYTVKEGGDEGGGGGWWWDSPPLEDYGFLYNGKKVSNRMRVQNRKKREF